MEEVSPFLNWFGKLKGLFILELVREGSLIDISNLDNIDISNLDDIDISNQTSWIGTLEQKQFHSNK